MKDLQIIIDQALIQKKANEAAEKAVLKEIKEYYTSYNSPFRKKIQEELQKQELSFAFDLPSILGNINEALKTEIQNIQNLAIANTYIPLINDVIRGFGKKITLTKILREIVDKLYDPEIHDVDEFQFSYKKSEKYSWLTCNLLTPSNHYEFTLYTVHESEKEEQLLYQILSSPRNINVPYNKKMNIVKDDVTLELPFDNNILNDEVLNLLFNIAIGKSHIIIDCDDFDEDWFIKDECHC